ncbi:HdaA/DnaA family protein [Kordiimonas lacus]|uniref:DnaA protein n=1 Tax=Kordiimonas lacus TaxID=637679 RepID=A0A1G6WTS5_9PROT|nr:DnaA/Hda family protein [Kordiimonas lacus]SDD69224.1 dnaA protein [Kordiimonas lacus]
MVKQAKQIPLELPHKPSFEMADFIVSASNEAAFSVVDGWPDWPHHAVALVGPAASGKTHLAKAWAKRADAIEVNASDEIDAIAPGSNVLVDGADAATRRDETLFHLFNWTKETGGHLLLTSRTAPNLWNVALPDLKSRLATIPVAEISEPDDHLLMVLLVKLFSDRQLQVDLAVVDYIIKRIERSFTAAKELVDAIDRHALADKRKITKALAKTCLEAPTDR